MTEDNSAPSSPAVAPKKSGLLKKAGFALAALLVLLVVAYFIVTSAMFHKGVVLPRVAKAIGAELTVEDTEISPFSRVSTRSLTVKTTGDEPLVTCDEVLASYRLFQQLRRLRQLQLKLPTTDLHSLQWHTLTPHSLPTPR